MSILEVVLVPVHAHVLLLGWASLALAGLVYHYRHLTRVLSAES